MSPTLYHKHLRLYEAQRRMLEDNEDATKASFAVGYESLTQFNREYKRLFGQSPRSGTWPICVRIVRTFSDAKGPASIKTGPSCG